MELPHLDVSIPQFIDYGLIARVTGLRLQEEGALPLQGADRSPALHDSTPRLPDRGAECSACHWRLCPGPRLQEEGALPLQGADRSPALHDSTPRLPDRGAECSACHWRLCPGPRLQEEGALPLQGADRSPALHDSTPRLPDRGAECSACHRRLGWRAANRRQEPIDDGVTINRMPSSHHVYAHDAQLIGMLEDGVGPGQ